MYDNQEEWQRETAILVSLDTGEYDSEISIEELRELANTAEIDVLAVLTQKRDKPDPATALGTGRAEELGELVEQTEAEMIIFDRELSPAQIRNLEEVCNCPVIDRTMLILNIFASRAVTKEGKLQVELASLRYQLPRLAGRGVQLSRQGGGGAGGGGARRGAGETKLETDRRHIRSSIEHLEQELKELTMRRGRHRDKRKKDMVTTVAIVGYTNVGKSTLLNTLTDAGVLAENKLFATLDPTSRALTLPDGRQVLLIDTVGLVRRLPHHLVEAFKSTLEEAASADLVLNVCDITSTESDEQLAVTKNLMHELDADDVPLLTVYNKCDILSKMPPTATADCVFISARQGMGLEGLMLAIQDALPATHIRLKLLVPYTAADLESSLGTNSKVYTRDYREDGILIDVNVDKTKLHLAKPYLFIGE